LVDVTWWTLLGGRCVAKQVTIHAIFYVLLN
jgi:hypothetical protein